MKKSTCKNCTGYSAYYRKRISSFERLPHGECVKHKKSTKSSETCNDFYMCELKKQRYEMFLRNSLEITANSINQITQILNEQMRQKKDQNEE